MKLTLISLNGKFLADSREVAEMVGKRHDHLLRDIDGYFNILTTAPNLGVSEFFLESTYQDGSGRTLKCYLLTKKGCDMVANKMIGEKGILFTAVYVTKFEEMESQLNKPLYVLPQTKIEAMEAYLEEMKKNVLLEAKIEADRSKVHFAEALQISTDSILIGELAKLLKQNGIDIGGQRLFKQLREEGYLMKQGEQYNMPTQRSMDLGVMEVKTGTRQGSEGAVHITRTPKITGKGQMYFINKFKSLSDSA